MQDVYVQIAGHLRGSVQNGDGLRNVVFFSGCKNNCIGCQNEQMKDFNYGDRVTVSEVIQDLSTDIDLIDGFTISGGEPFCQPEALNEIVTKLKEEFSDKTIWIYSGYTLEQIQEMNTLNSDTLKKINVLVDGKFDINQPSVVRYKGSANQRILRSKEGIFSDI